MINLILAAAMPFDPGAIAIRHQEIATTEADPLQFDARGERLLCSYRRTTVAG